MPIPTTSAGNFCHTQNCSQQHGDIWQLSSKLLSKECKAVRCCSFSTKELLWDVMDAVGLLRVVGCCWGLYTNHATHEDFGIAVGAWLHSCERGSSVVWNSRENRKGCWELSTSPSHITRNTSSKFTTFAQYITTHKILTNPCNTHK